LTAGRVKTKGAAERSLGVCSRHGVLRPTSSKVRESVFNILRERVEDAVFVDLYAGTGAVGMEAMSRGARTVFFVEADRRRAGSIEETIEGCGCRAKAVVVKKKAEDFIRKAASEGGSFDIVFLDPPYYSTEMGTVLPLVGEGPLLNDGALVLAEHLSKRELPDEVGVLRKKKTYKYGDTTLTLYRKA
jgi:16S rRNA (guanine(966)-N(2))-methyltransferase RsmD